MYLLKWLLPSCPRNRAKYVNVSWWKLNVLKCLVNSKERLCDIFYYKEISKRNSCRNFSSDFSVKTKPLLINIILYVYQIHNYSNSFKENISIRFLPSHKLNALKCSHNRFSHQNKQGNPTNNNFYQIDGQSTSFQCPLHLLPFLTNHQRSSVCIKSWREHFLT